MAKIVLLPALSPTMETGTIARWLVKIGDTINPGDELLEIETDKAVMVHEAVEEGVIGDILVKEGTENVSVNQPIAIILENGEKIDDINIPDMLSQKNINAHKGYTQKNEQTSQKIALSDKKSLESKAEKTRDDRSITNHKDKRVFITPLAKIIAQQNNLDITQIKGSGPNGRIVKSDIEAILTDTQHNVFKTSADHVKNIQSERLELSLMRKTIAQRLTEAKNHVPHFYLKASCCVDALIEMREFINEKSQQRISINDIIVKACAIALIEIPEVNRSFCKDHIMQHNSADISIAVSVEEGLYTPIIFNAQNLSFADIAIKVKNMVEKAKNKKLTPNEYEGGNFSISNLGMFNIKEFTAIINPPQSAILAVGCIEKTPIIHPKTEKITVQSVMTLTLSCDHRIVDGVLGARFLNLVKAYLEKPIRLLI